MAKTSGWGLGAAWRKSRGNWFIWWSSWSHRRAVFLCLWCKTVLPLPYRILRTTYLAPNAFCKCSWVPGAEFWPLLGRRKRDPTKELLGCSSSCEEQPHWGASENQRGYCKDQGGTYKWISLEPRNHDDSELVVMATRAKTDALSLWSAYFTLDVGSVLLSIRKLPDCTHGLYFLFHFQFFPSFRLPV